MTDPSQRHETSDLVRTAARRWVARMSGPDAERLREEFDAWLTRDPRHKAAYEDVEAKYQLAASLGETAVGREWTLPPAHDSLSISRGRQALLAASLIAAAVVVGAIVSSSSHTRPDTVLAGGGAPSTKVGEIRKLHLNDGSIVTLDTNSRIQVGYTSRVRIVRLLRGRARFEVAHDAGRLFIVEAGGEMVTARGTVFDVCLCAGNVDVTLLRGRVDVARGTAATPAVVPVARLVAGQSLVAEPQAAAPKIAPVHVGEDHWPDGLLSFDGEPLKDVLEQTNRYSITHITLSDPSLANLRVTGGFRPVPVDKLAASLAAAFDLEAERRSEGDLLLKPRGGAVAKAR